jgi:hypothetical protein
LGKRNVMPRARKRNTIPGSTPITIDLKTGEGPVRVVLPLELVISLAKDHIERGAIAMEAEDAAEVAQLEDLYGG